MKQTKSKPEKRHVPVSSTSLTGMSLKGTINVSIAEKQGRLSDNESVCKFPESVPENQGESAVDISEPEAPAMSGFEDSILNPPGRLAADPSTQEMPDPNDVTSTSIADRSGGQFMHHRLPLSSIENNCNPVDSDTPIDPEGERSRHKGRPDKWQVNVRKCKQNLGEEYTTRKNKIFKVSQN